MCSYYGTDPIYSFYGTPTMWEMAGSKFCTPINANQTQSLPIWILGPWTVKLLLLSSFTKRLEAGCYCNEGRISILSLSFSLGELRWPDWKSGMFLAWLEGEWGKLTIDQVRLRLCCTTRTLVSCFIPTKQLLWFSLEVCTLLDFSTTLCQMQWTQSWLNIMWHL